MNDLASVATTLRRSRGIVVLTGAGVSVESGIRPFRGADGWWEGHDPSRLATPEAFAADPALVSAWYDTRRRAVLAARPNPAHHAIAALERRVVNAGGRFAVLTQNVDGLHHRAGSEQVVELHGNITVWRDHRSGRTLTPPPEPFAAYPQPGPDGGWLRPDVVWFGEHLPTAAWKAAEEALGWCELFLVVGTSAVVHPAAGLIDRARAAGAVTVEVNVEETAARVQHRLIGPAGEVLPRLLDAAFGTPTLRFGSAHVGHVTAAADRSHPSSTMRHGRDLQEVKAMDDEATVFEFEERGNRATVAAFLRQLADGIERGRVELLHDGARLVVEPPDDLELEVEVELEDEGTEGIESSIEIEISWTELTPP